MQRRDAPARSVEANAGWYREQALAPQWVRAVLLSAKNPGLRTWNLRWLICRSTRSEQLETLQQKPKRGDGARINDDRAEYIADPADEIRF
jgi:hypothetical protein